MQDNGAQAPGAAKPPTRLDQAFEHGRIERVELFRPVEPDLGDAFGDSDADPAGDRFRVAHGFPPEPTGSFEPSPGRASKRKQTGPAARA